MTRISWINTLYDQRANILAADTELNDKYLSSKKEDLSFGREKDYEIYAIQILATILDGIEEGNAETQARPHVQHYRMKLTGQLSRSRLITNLREFPNWVLCPDILHVYLQENAIDVIKGLNKSRCESTWRCNISTEERAKIVHTRLLRRFDLRVQKVVGRRRPMAALCHIFDARFAERLRSVIDGELEARRHMHPSIWNQVCGVWLIVEHVLLGILTEYEDESQGQVRERITGRSSDRLNRLFKDRFYSFSDMAGARKRYCV
ncbi:hypothetical protein F5Y07DRAFT_404170 [Xylaria sp. FL0933]|nr:hypothetical protein F5Y07DRAFT_404170 [Xylaria sp. FL0933]